MKVVDALSAIERALPGRTRRDVPMAPLTAYKVGGPAELFVEPNTAEELVALLEIVHREQVPLFVLGAGSNLLVRDGGVQGAVLRLGREFRRVAVSGEELTAGAMVQMSKVALAAERAGP